MSKAQVWVVVISVLMACVAALGFVSAEWFKLLA